MLRAAEVVTVNDRGPSVHLCFTVAMLQVRFYTSGLWLARLAPSFLVCSPSSHCSKCAGREMGFCEQKESDFNSYKF
ncbi:hypothetical protein DOTSEDRAFT_71245 [Dothistroma septosporum NZE10]|uniref:Uncharacterized protein n=1 Tax=Dothistroma septosporum (strain NZE10 / CBS 128990) TaxID=675120 RepID=N1PR95_DOTSN|nr:hypothetical protein DOTSEDRAFT_71245 [Dothistroma septosporum NZE10]